MRRPAAISAAIVLAASLAGTGVAAFAAGPDGGGVVRQRGVDDPGRGLQELARDLHDRQRALDRREAAINYREQALREVEARLTTRMQELEALRVKIESEIRAGEDERQKRVVNLSKTVEGMKPSAAADVLAAAELDLATEVIRRMPPSKAGKIMASMEPKRAAQITSRWVEGPPDRKPAPEAPRATP
jgi:flagellar motility protein MotE (MotC chaperone)